MLDNYHKKIQSKQNLTMEESRACLGSILEKDYEDQEIANLLLALSEKGEAISEISGFAQAMLAKKVSINLPDKSIDLCGTGGSGLNRFNISTTVSFVLSAHGVPVVKHGNKGSKHPNGSFDLLEELGLPLDLSISQIESLFAKTNLAFIFARQFHPAMKKVAGARKLAAKRTIFNLLGPLCNPVQPRHQIIGTTNHQTASLVIEALQSLGRKRCLVINAEPGIDEISISGSSHIFELKDNVISEMTIHPADFNIPLVKYDDIPGGDAKENSALFISVIQNKKPESLLNMVSLNAGAAFYCFGTTASIKEGFVLAKKIITDGKCEEQFNKFKSELSKIKG